MRGVRRLCRLLPRMLISTLAATSVGGDLYYSLGLSILGDIPRRPQWPTKFHAWINAGRLQGINRCGHCLSPAILSTMLILRSTHPSRRFQMNSAPTFQPIHTAITQPSISVGLGLVYRFDPIRVEVNLGVPLVAAKGEILKRGPQVGIGLEFL